MATKKVERVLELVKAAEFRRAMELVDPTRMEIANISQRVFQQLRQLHPRRQERPVPMEEAAPVLQPPQGSEAEPKEEVLTDSIIKTAVWSMKRLAAPGPSGWSKELLAPALQEKDSTGPAAVCEVLRRLAYGKVSDAFSPYVYGARLVALKKDTRESDGKIRPIAVGELLTKAASKALYLATAGSLAGILRAQGQFGVAVPNELEKIVHSINTLAELATRAGDNDFMVVQLDFSNAFNTAARHLIRRELAAKEELHILLPYFDARYPAQAQPRRILGCWPAGVLHRIAGGCPAGRPPRASPFLSAPCCCTAPGKGRPTGVRFRCFS